MRVRRQKMWGTGIIAAAMAGSLVASGAVAAGNNSPAAEKNDYIVLLHDRMGVASVATADLTVSAVAKAEALGAEVELEYRALGGYAASMTPAQAEQVRQDPDVQSVELDYEVRSAQARTEAVPFPMPTFTPFPMPTSEPTSEPTPEPVPPTTTPAPAPTTPRPAPTTPRPAPTTSAPAPGPAPTSRRPGGFFPDDPYWGLDRIDQRDMPLRGDGQRVQVPGTGEGVHIYVIDTGILATHSEFTGRIGEGYDFVNDDDDPNDDHEFINARGHGTMSASIAAGTKWGVAKGATVHAVKSMGQMGSGKGKHVMAGINWVADNMQKPAVVNMSIGAPDNETENEAVNRMIDNGAVVVAAAGNNAGDACEISPASVPRALTVSASTHKDEIASSFANYGSCVDLFAPGFFVGGASNKDDNAEQQAQGTSQSAPYVAGAAAVYLGNHPDATPEQVHQVIVETASNNKLSGELKGSPNRLLYVGDLR